MPVKDRDRLHSGRRDQTITIEQRSDTDSAESTSGEPVETWTTLVSNMPASRLDTSGDERFVADQTAAKFDIEWEINWRADMDPELYDIPKVRRVVLADRVHDIVSCVEVGRRAGLILRTCASSKVPTQ